MATIIKSCPLPRTIRKFKSPAKFFFFLLCFFSIRKFRGPLVLSFILLTHWGVVSEHYRRFWTAVDLILAYSELMSCPIRFVIRRGDRLVNAMAPSIFPDIIPLKNAKGRHGSSSVCSFCSPTHQSNRLPTCPEAITKHGFFIFYRQLHKSRLGTTWLAAEAI